MNKKVFQGIAEAIFEDYLQTSINSDMDKISFAINPAFYAVSEENEKALLLALSMMKNYTKHGMFLKCNVGNKEGHELIVSNKPMAIKNKGMYYIYEIF